MWRSHFFIEIQIDPWHRGGCQVFYYDGGFNMKTLKTIKKTIKNRYTENEHNVIRRFLHTQTSEQERFVLHSTAHLKKEKKDSSGQR